MQEWQDTDSSSDDEEHEGAVGGAGAAEGSDDSDDSDDDDGKNLQIRRLSSSSLTIDGAHHHIEQILNCSIMTGLCNFFVVAAICSR